MKHFETIRSIFESGNGYAKTREILAKGIHPAHLKSLAMQGTIVQIKQGLYRWEGMAFWGNDLHEIARMIPNGVFCLLSAAAYHELSTHIPWQHHMAVERSTKVKLPPGALVKIYYFPKPLMDLGVLRVTTEGGEIRMFDAARTVCDLAKFRNKTGQDTMLEAIREYLRRPDKNLALLFQYARLLRVKKVLMPYFEIATLQK